MISIYICIYIFTVYSTCITFARTYVVMDDTSKKTTKLASFCFRTPCQLLFGLCWMILQNWLCTSFWFGWQGCTQPLLNFWFLDLWSQVLPTWRSQSNWVDVQYRVYSNCKENEYWLLKHKIIVEFILNFVLSWKTLLPNAITRWSKIPPYLLIESKLLRYPLAKFLTSSKSGISLFEDILRNVDQNILMYDKTFCITKFLTYNFETFRLHTQTPHRVQQIFHSIFSPYIKGDCISKYCYIFKLVKYSVSEWYEIMNKEITTY
jgi:hypothetical protein